MLLKEGVVNRLINGRKARLFYLAVMMLFFFCVFDGLLTNVMPVLMVQRGISEELMGFIIGLSAVFGFLFDFWLCRILFGVHYKRIYLFILLLAGLFSLLLFNAGSVGIFIVGMAIWGLYYDLLGMANIDLVADTNSKSDYSKSFGILRIFVALGYLVATIITGFFLTKYIDTSFFMVGWLVWFFSAFIFLFLIFGKDDNVSVAKQTQRASLRREIFLWRSIGWKIFPVLIVTFMINLVDSFFWVIGPLLAINLARVNDLGVWFITFYLFPLLITGWLVGGVSRKLGKKKTAILALFFGFLVLSWFHFFENSVWLLVLGFVSSFFISFAWPAISGAYADYVSEKPDYAKEVEALQDSFTNLGYMLGPTIAGLLAYNYGYESSFSILGVAGVIISIILLILTPKKISIV